MGKLLERAVRKVVENAKEMCKFNFRCQYVGKFSSVIQ